MYKVIQTASEHALEKALTALHKQRGVAELFSSCARGLDEVVHTAVVRLGDLNLTYSGNSNTSGTAPTDTVSYASGAKVIVQAPGDLAKTGKVFKEWNTAANGSGTGYAPGANFTIAADGTLYAIWETYYTLSYNKNDGTATGDAPVDATKYLSDAVTVVKDAGELAVAGKTFVKWNTAAAGTGTDVFPGSALTIAANTTLYAIWSA